MKCSEKCDKVLHNTAFLSTLGFQVSNDDAFKINYLRLSKRQLLNGCFHAHQINIFIHIYMLFIYVPVSNTNNTN